MLTQRLLLLSFLLVTILIQHIYADCPASCRCKDKGEVICENKGLTAIPRCSDCENISYLDLSHNEIRKLTEESFKDYPNLKRLSLNYNKIHIIDSLTFKQQFDLKEIEIAKNNLSRIDMNSFTFLYTLKSISLEDNPVVISSPFLSSGTLTTLTLSGCQLKNLPNDTFALLPELQYILLENNYLTELPYDIFEPLTKLQKVYLRGNPWRCGGYLEHLKNTKPDLIDDIKNINCLRFDETIVTSVEEQLHISIQTLENIEVETSPSAADDLINEDFSASSVVVVYIYGAAISVVLIACAAVICILRHTIKDCFSKMRNGISSVDLRRSGVDYVDISKRSPLEPIYDYIA